MAGPPRAPDQRLSAAQVLDHLATGITEDALLAAFPLVRPEDVHAAIAHQAASRRLLALRGKLTFALSWEQLRGKDDD
ncbi:MAG: DUF433 domain-containing protein [Hyphomonadaceae bacterium]|nr:DUF433 domain-containing protein [Hyphomonadaceae bacterium]